MRNRTNTDLRTPEALFAAARGAGFAVVVACVEINQWSHFTPSSRRSYRDNGAHLISVQVVAVYRHNALARAVSSFEIHRYADLKPADAGSPAARRREAKLKQRASDNFCNKPGALQRHFGTERDLYDRGLRAARANGLKVLRFSFEAVTGDLCGTIKKTTSALGCESRCRCQPTESQHQRTSRRDRSLAGRTSPEAARCITAELGGDARYAWMLNLTATRPPPAVEASERRRRKGWV